MKLRPITRTCDKLKIDRTPHRLEEKVQSLENGLLVLCEKIENLSTQLKG